MQEETETSSPKLRIICFRLDGQIIFNQSVALDDDGPPIEFAFVVNACSTKILTG